MELNFFKVRPSNIKRIKDMYINGIALEYIKWIKGININRIKRSIVEKLTIFDLETTKKEKDPKVY